MKVIQNFLNETVNILDKELYARQKSRKFDLSIDLHTQNTLLMQHRPGVLLKYILSAP